MKVIFVLGRYRADTDEELYQNIQHARTEARKLWHKGWAVICPHMNSSFMSGSDAEENYVYIKGYEELLRRCDAVYVLNGSSYSLGAMEEYKLAEELGIEIYVEYGGIPNAPSDK